MNSFLSYSINSIHQFLTQLLKVINIPGVFLKQILSRIEQSLAKICLPRHLNLSTYIDGHGRLRYRRLISPLLTLSILLNYM